MVAMLARIGKAASALFTGRMQVSGLTAGNADRTILQSSRTEPGRAVLSASSWWGGLVRSAAPPGSSSARAGSDTRRPASAPDSFDPPPAPAPAGARAAVRNRWFGLFPALFCLPLWFDFAVSAQAQQSITDLVQMSRTTRAVAEFSPTPSMRAIVEIGDGLTPVSWARTINYTLGGTADLGSGKDYTIEGCKSSPCSVHLRANTHSVPIVLVMNNDGLDEDEETIVITLQDGSGYTVNQDRKTSTISIRDDDTRGLTFHRRWPDVREGGSDTMTVRLSSQPTAPVTVTIVSNTPDVTVNPSTLTFNPSGSDRWSKERTITVAAAQDDDAVDDMATLVYTTTGGDYGGANALRIERTVRVDDDDPRTTPGSQGPTISLTGGAAVTEGEAASFTVNASPAPTARLTVNIEVVEHPGQDFVAASEERVRTVTLNSGATSASFTVPTVNDGTDEDDGYVQALVRDGTGYVAGGGSDVPVRDDDEPTPAVNFGSASSSPAEGDGTHLVGVDLTRPAPSGGLAISYGVTGTATAGSGNDYTIQGSGTLSVAAGATSATIPVAIHDDSARESAETVILTLAEGTDYTVSNPGVHTLTITDNDGPTNAPGLVISQQNALGVPEGGTGRYTVKLATAPTGTVTVNIASDNGDVTVNPAPLTFHASGSSKLWSTAQTVTVSARQDSDTVDDTATLTHTASGGGYGSVAAASVTVEVDDDDEPTPAVNFASAASSAAEGGGTHRVGVDLTEPAPSGGLALNYNVTGSATAGSGNDYTIQGSGTLSVAAGATAATILVAIHDDRANESAETVVLTLAGGTGYTLGSPGVHTLTITDNDAPPPNTPGLVISQQNALGVPEGGTGSYTVKLATAPTGTVTVSIASDNADVTVNPAPLTFHASGSSELWSSAQTVTVSARQDSDAVDDTATLTHTASGGGYGSVTAASITVEVDDDDSPREPQTTTPVVGIAGGGAITEGGTARFTVTARPAPASSVTVPIQVDSGNIGVESGQDGLRTVTIGTTGTATLTVTTTVDDAVDAVGRITSTVQAGTDYSVAAASVASVRVVTPGAQSAPVAWLVRFGRSVAEQVLDGIKGRMAAVRSAGFTGSIGGSALGFGPRAGPGAGPTAGADETGVAPASAPASADFLAGGGPVPAARPPLSERDRKFGPGRAAGLSRTLTGQELMPGSRFTLTGERDASGGSVAFWGRAAQSGFDGREGRLSLDGKAVTGMLGADYARDRWLVGVALTQSDGEGEYRGGDAGSGSGSDGDIETTLTAAVPYASLQISERLELWGALGHGAGEVVLKPESGGVLESEISWTMASLGLRGDVLAPHAEGPALALVSDMLWARTTSDKAHELAASDSEVTRLRLGLEGSWPQALRKGGTPGSGSGASVTPRLAAGLRHDDGDAESGFGVELGGGLAWVDPRLGLSLDLSGRRLVTHDADGMEDEGFAASVAFDPDPATERGPSLAVRQETGGASSGGLDALFETASPSARTGSENDTRWSAEAAWGFPAISQRFTGSPHVGLGVATGARDYTLGWRLEPVAGAPAVSLGALATRRESDAAAPEHTGGLEISARW